MTGHGTEDLEHEIEKSWTANAAAWADVVRQDLIASRRIGTNRAVFDAILERQPRRVLDVGCGEGWLAHQLAGNGIDVVGFDSSDALLEHARAGAGTFHRLSYDAFASNPAQTGHGFDVAVCNFSLLGKDIAHVLRACAAVLAPGGVLVIQTIHPFMDALQSPYEDGWRREDFSGMPATFSASMPWYFRTMSTWIEDVAGAGFVVESVREPLHPETRRPLSMLVIGSKQGHTSTSKPH